MTSSHKLRWRHGEATVLSTAAMLLDCSFALPDRSFSPFALAPWVGTLNDRSISGHLRELGGDFVCLPFGAGGPFSYAHPDWAPLMEGPAYRPIHGPVADAEWDIVEASESGIVLALDYPQDGLIQRVERRIAVQPDAPGLDFSFTIFARHAGRISAGLHPILRLPERPGALELTAEFDFGLVHPRQAMPERPQEFASLSAVPRPSGSADFTHVPIDPRTDANVQLCGMHGPLTARYLDEDAGVILDWDRAILPSLQIWHTDRGIAAPPFGRNYRGIGVEPIAAAFDLNDRVSVGNNPINARGIATAVELNPGAPLLIRHSITAFAFSH